MIRKGIKGREREESRRFREQYVWENRGISWWKGLVLPLHLSVHALCLITTVSPVFVLDSISNHFPGGADSVYACKCMYGARRAISWRTNHRSQTCVTLCLWCQQPDWMWPLVNIEPHQPVSKRSCLAASYQYRNKPGLDRLVSVCETTGGVRYWRCQKVRANYWWGHKVWGSVETPISVCLHFCAWGNWRQEDPRTSCLMNYV